MDDPMKIVSIMPRYGDLYAYENYYVSLKQITNEVYPFWSDEYIDKKEELQKEVIKFVDNIKPTLICFYESIDAFEFTTLDYLKSKYTTFAFFGNDMYCFDFTRYYAPHLTYAITANKLVLSKYREMGYKNVILSMWAFAGSTEDIDFDAIKYKYDVSFVGRINCYRKWFVNRLKGKGINVECFGGRWKNGWVSFDEMKKIFRTSKINLNIPDSDPYDIRFLLSSVKNPYEALKVKRKAKEIKGRHFEIPGFGGFQLTNYAPFLGDYFKIGSEVATYASIEDLPAQINYYLDNESERRRIMINGYKRAINEHTYVCRLKDIFEKMGMPL